MNKPLILLALLVLIPPAASAKEISIDGGSITLVVPDDFTELSQEEINLKFPSVNAPKQVVGNENRATTIAFKFHDEPMEESDLPDAQKAFTQVFDRIVPGIEWKRNNIVKFAGQKWLLMEMTSRAIDQDIHNILLLTPHKGKMLAFNFNSTKADFPRMEQALKDSVRSIKLKP